MRSAAMLSAVALSACVAPNEGAQEYTVGASTVSGDVLGADAGPVDEGNGIVGLVSGGMTDTGSQSWEYTLLDCATGSYVLVSTFDEFGVSGRRSLRLARYVDKQRKAGTTGSLQAFFDASSKAGMNPLENQFHQGWYDETGCKKYYPAVNRAWPKMTKEEEEQLKANTALIAATVGVSVVQIE